MITITKAGFIPYDWIDKQWTEVKEMHPFALLRETVDTIEEGTTIGDLIRIVAQDDILCMFFDAYSGCDLGELYHEMLKPTPDEPNEDGYAHVYIVAEFTENIKGQRELSYYRGFGGRDFTSMRNAPGEHEPANPEGECSLSAVSIRKLAGIPIKLVDAGHLSLWKSKGEKMRQQALEAKFERVGCRFSLLEFLDAIFNDISFWGDEKDKVILHKSLQEKMKSIEDGTAVLHPFEEAFS